MNIVIPAKAGIQMENVYEIMPQFHFTICGIY